MHRYLDLMFEEYKKPKSVYFVVENKGKIIGGAGIAPLENEAETICELQKMYFLPEARGLGIGSQMMEKCLQAAHFRGCRRRTGSLVIRERSCHNENATTVTLNELSALYDVSFIDQFGVLRGGEVAYAGASQALVHLKAQGKTIVILSNSGRSGPYNISRLAKLGFDSTSFDRFVTSGDVAPALLIWSAPREKQKQPLPDNSKWRGPCSCRKAGLLQRGYCRRCRSGHHLRQRNRAYPACGLSRPPAPAAKRGVPCICTNPDVHKLVGETLLPAAGTIAALYEEMGGKVTRIGKPYVDIYRHAHALCGHPDKARIVAIGDSLEHDVIGAATFGIDSALALTGLQAHVSEAALLAQMQEGQIAPRYLLGSFVWIE